MVLPTDGFIGCSLNLSTPFNCFSVSIGSIRANVFFIRWFDQVSSLIEFFGLFFLFYKFCLQFIAILE